MVNKEELELFKSLLEENRYCFEQLVYIIFPFGQKDHPLEHQAPYAWQLEEWRKLSMHMTNPRTRFETYRMIVSSGNGAAKTAFGAMTLLMLMFTQRLRARVTANTDPQLKTVVWPEIDVWFRHARYSDHFFEKLGTSIKAKNEAVAQQWRIDTITWNEETPAAISGLHNKGGAVAYVFEEAPGIPANIWSYASGAFTETETIKVWMAFGNSDDPESKFEQNMVSPLWHSRRIDTRTLAHIDKQQIANWLEEAGGDEDNDEFRTRVRGLPRKAAKDSIIRTEVVSEAISKAKGFDLASVSFLPVILTCDPAWRGGDETTIAYSQGNYSCLLERYKLRKELGEDHMMTYQKLVHWERELGADAVLIDQGEGTAIYTIANNNGKSWELISFANSPNDQGDPKLSEYGNIRAQMYYEFAKWLARGGVIDSKDQAWISDIQTQLCWTKGTRHKTTLKKMCESKLEIKTRVGQSPDISDAFVLTRARPVLERLPENDRYAGENKFETGSQPYKMPDHVINYDEDNTVDAEYRTLYD